MTVKCRVIEWLAATAGRVWVLAAVLCSTAHAQIQEDVGADPLTPWAAQSINSPAQSASPFSSLGGVSSRQLGLEVLRLINRSGERLADPWVDAQLDEIFARMRVPAGLNQSIGVVVLRDPSINAFAVPGGLVGFHTGLILEAQNLDEVAGVMAHEAAHLSQNHFGRRSDARRYDWVVQTLGLIGAAFIGGGSDASSALAIGSQALVADRALSFSRDQESEADRVGLSLMQQSGYAVSGMPRFFEKLLAIANREDKVTQFLRSHPLSSARVSDIRARLTNAQNQQTPSASSSFTVLRWRLLALTNRIDSSRALEANLSDSATRIGVAMVLTAQNQPAEALKLLQNVTASFDLEEVLFLARIEALLQTDPKQAQLLAARATSIFPESLALKKLEILARMKSGMSPSNLAGELDAGLIPPTQQLEFWRLRLLELQSHEGSPVEALRAQAEILYEQNQLESALVSLKRAQSVCAECAQKAKLKQRYQQIMSIYRDKSLL